VTQRYKVFTHLLGEIYNAEGDNFLWGQQDNEPGGGQAPTTLWPVGSIVVDTYRIPVDPQAPPGTYAIEAGIYGLVDGIRLPVVSGGLDVIDNAVLLATVVVE
jgi:hypothetical protein